MLAVKTGRKGFTLIELSIVLVIIGLLVGGVLAGQTLIAAAQVRKEISKLNSISTAINTFRVKYDALPGDMANATTYFGADPACNPTDVSISVSV